MVAGRRSYIDLLSPNQTDTTKGGFYFYDLNAKYNAYINEKNRFYLSGYFGRDKFHNEQTDKTSRNVTYGEIGWGYATLTARWNHVFGTRLFSNTSLTHTGYFISCSKEYYLFYQTAPVNLGIDPKNSSTVENLYSNIKGGYGIFAGYNALALSATSTY